MSITDILIICSICLIGYIAGLFSAARVVAKVFKNIKLSKVGSGHLDTENIYSNVNRTLGVFVGIVDIVKICVFLFLIEYLTKLIFKSELYCSDNLLFIYGFFLILGHCFPVYNKFRGGRGIFTFAGYIGYFAPVTMLIVGFLSTIMVVVFNQKRAAKYFTVGAPVISSLIASTIMQDSPSLTTKILIASILMVIVNFLVSRKRREL